MRLDNFVLTLLLYCLLPCAQLRSTKHTPEFRKMLREFKAGPRKITSEQTDKQKQVVETMKWAWGGYKKYAWGQDHLLPVSKSHDNWFNLGLTLLDAMDTLWLMNLRDEYNEARKWVQSTLNFDQDVDVNLFECTIRILGGLLSSYMLTGDPLFRNKAVDLGDRLMVAFDSHSGIPLSDVNIGQRTAHGPRWSSDSSTSEVTTIQMEFKTLSNITGDPKYKNVVDKVMSVVKANRPSDGLVSMWINPNSGQFTGSDITLGARGDSYYEYLLKSWILTGKTDENLRNEYLHAVDSIMSQLVRESSHGLTFIGERHGWSGSGITPKMDHLVCFFAGTLALGAYHEIGSPKINEKHMELAEKLAYTCNEMYTRFETGLAPEIVMFRTSGSDPKDLYVKHADKHNLLRPETVESFFVLHRITGDKKYVEWGWKIYEAFERHTKIDTGGYSSLSDVTMIPPPKRNKMESFFLGETLKYLFLLFGSEEHQKRTLPLDEIVFNTEAHPLRIFDDK